MSATVAVAISSGGVGQAVKVAPTACCTVVPRASAVAVVSGVGWRVTGTGVAMTVTAATTGVGAGGWAVKVALMPATTSACTAFAVAVRSTVVVAGNGVVVKVGSAVLLLPPAPTVRVAIGSGALGPPIRSPKK